MSNTKTVPERNVTMNRTHVLMTTLMAAASILLLAGCPSEVTEATKAAYAFVDEDGDGICDTCDQGNDADGDSTCDNFIDEDGDGLCDNRQSHKRLGWEANGYQFRDGNGDGQCDMCSGDDLDGDGVCDNFVDEDGDGVCDNRQSHTRLGQGSYGYQYQDQNGDGQCDLCDGQDLDGDGVCDNFVDEDGDGVCDNRQSHVRYGWEIQGYKFQDRNGDRLCDRCGEQDSNGDGICDGFVDADGDGVCDSMNSHEQHGNANGRG